MSDVPQPIREILFRIDPALDSFLKGEIACNRAASEQDYITSLLVEARQRHVDAHLRDKQLANSLGHASDMI